MLYQIAYLCETASGQVWMWITGPIADPIEAELTFDFYLNQFHSDTVEYTCKRTEAELQMWLKQKNAAFYEQNTPTKRASLPEESGLGGDRDTPYKFTLPKVWREQEAWLQLAGKYRRGELQS